VCLAIRYCTWPATSQQLQAQHTSGALEIIRATRLPPFNSFAPVSALPARGPHTERVKAAEFTRARRAADECVLSTWGCPVIQQRESAGS
jgi:hypothetical protein